MLDAGRDAGNMRARRDDARDHAARLDDRAVADARAAQQGDPRAEDGAAADLDGRAGAGRLVIARLVEIGVEDEGKGADGGALADGDALLRAVADARPAADLDEAARAGRQV